MTDLHTHILPGMDDGAKTPEESIAMLRLQRDQGVDTVVLTPHFYRDRERPEHFLRRRAQAMERLNQALARLDAEERATLPKLTCGAEVAWFPGLEDVPELEQLCIGETENMLLELPFVSWNDQMIRGLYDMMGRVRVNPVLAHLERYIKIQRPKHIRDILELGVDVQVSSDVLLHPFARRSCMRLLRERTATVVASDCHNTTRRTPDLAAGFGVIDKVLGRDAAEELRLRADELAGLNV